MPNFSAILMKRWHGFPKAHQMIPLNYLAIKSGQSIVSQSLAGDTASTESVYFFLAAVSFSQLPLILKVTFKMWYDNIFMMWWADKYESSCDMLLKAKWWCFGFFEWALLGTGPWVQGARASAWNNIVVVQTTQTSKNRCNTSTNMEMQNNNKGTTGRCKSTRDREWLKTDTTCNWMQSERWHVYIDRIHIYMFNVYGYI